MSSPCALQAHLLPAPGKDLSSQAFFFFFCPSLTCFTLPMASSRSEADSAALKLHRRSPMAAHLPLQLTTLQTSLSPCTRVSQLNPKNALTNPPLSVPSGADRSQRNLNLHPRTKRALEKGAESRQVLQKTS